MKKLFGEYLVELGLISKDHLLEALVMQVSSMPAPIELIWNEKILTCDQCLEVLKLQSLKNIDIETAIKELGYYSESVLKKLSEATKKRHKPLGQILITQGRIKFDALIKALDDFVYDAEQEAKTPKKIIRAIDNKNNVDDFDQEKATADQNLDSNEEIASLSPNGEAFEENLAVLFLDTLADENLAAVRLILNKDKSEHALNILSEIAAGGRFINANLTATLAELAWQAWSSDLPSIDSEIVENIYHLLTKLKSSIEEKCSESGFWNDSELQSQYLKTINILKLHGLGKAS